MVSSHVRDGKSFDYRPKRSFGQGNIFTSVCHSFCSWGGPPIFRGGAWSREVPPNFLGGQSGPRGVPPNFRGGWGFSKFAWGGFVYRNTVNVRLVRIILECILVLQFFCHSLIQNRKNSGGGGWSGVNTVSRSKSFMLCMQIIFIWTS